ncbi:hypothetical protein H6G89_23715 [Oscillatoria sp. FACHB-1407]|uniref:hypothetical protein n=1 Tax=Oscillatoria sp. FACHB-1407 TaxID=2692847 RepID=UPI001688613F|nr:hypothetical protein [Oscillatoria sp. FACHB-1407]MBD2464014.1 hypothetical protein [Oscillatoria sp. FACHB-1407]MDX2214056.1 hypothetical protein [Oculatellaceae cyanobacterium bins.114]
MQPQAPHLQIPLEDLVHQILLLRRVTRAEESWLFSLLASPSLTEEQRVMIQRVFYGLRHDLLKLVD